MKVRMLTGFASTAATWNVGEIIDMPDSRARRLIERGYAMPMRQEPIETTALPKIAEMAVKRPRKSVRKRNVEPD